MNFKILIPILTLSLFSCNEAKPDKEKIDKTEKPALDPTTQVIEDEQKETTTYILDDLLNYDSEKELIAKFGKENIERMTQYYPEGMGEYTSTLLYPKTPNEVIFSWNDDTLNFEKLGTVKIAMRASEWVTKKGLKIGLSLKDLEKINGKEFKFFGFEWDYAGAVDFNEGTLDDRNTFCALTYIYDYENPEIVLPKEYLSLIGDGEFLSSNKNAQSVDLTVSEIVLSK